MLWRGAGHVPVNRHEICAHTCPPAPKYESLPPHCLTDPTSCGQQQQKLKPAIAESRVVRLAVAVAATRAPARCCHCRYRWAAAGRGRQQATEEARDPTDWPEEGGCSPHSGPPALAEGLANRTQQVWVPRLVFRECRRVGLRVCASVPLSLHLLSWIIPAVVAETGVEYSERQQAREVRERVTSLQLSWPLRPNVSPPSNILPFSVKSCVCARYRPWRRLRTPRS